MVCAKGNHMALLDLLKRKKNFTDTEEALADYILGHADEVAEMNIGVLSASAHTSNAAVVRLCRKVGIDGYRDFRIALARELERSRSQMLDVNPDTPFIEGNNTRDILSSIAMLSHQAIDAAYAMTSPAEIRKAAQLIRGARRVALFAIGDSAVTLEGFANLLLKLGVVCTQGIQHDDENVLSLTLDARDLAILVTHSGGLIDRYPSAVKILRERGCKILLITANEGLHERLAGTECVILVPEGETRSGRIATFFSQECIRYVLNCIYSEVFSRNWQDSMSRIERYMRDDHYGKEPEL